MRGRVRQLRVEICIVWTKLLSEEVMFWGRYRFLRARYFIIVETNGAEPILTRDSGGVYYFSSGGLMALNMR